MVEQDAVRLLLFKKLGKNRLFGNEITDAFWVFKIVLKQDREKFIRDSFEEHEVHFSYPHDLDDFNYLVGNFMQDKSDYVDSELGEELAVTRLIIMDEVSGLADKSKNHIFISKIWLFLSLYISYNISRQAKLGDDNVSNSHF